MTKQQHKKVLRILEVIICILLFLGIVFMFLGLSKAYNIEIKHNIKIKKVYKVRGYTWEPYAFTLQKRLIKLGYSDNDSVIIINNCKKQGKLGNIKNVGRCIKTAGMIGYTESSGWRNCYHNSCMGLYSGRKWYKNKDEGFKDWVSRYVKYWYNHSNPYEYYGKNPLTHYCTDGNMNALHNANYAYNILNYNK